MFKGFKEFTYKMIAGANVATIIIMLLVGFSDFFQPEKFAALANLGLLFPVFGRASCRERAFILV